MIEIDMEKCSGCRRCEAVCSFSHFDGDVGRETARVKVAKLEELGLDYPLLCLQCEERYCVRECPVDALSVGEEGQVSVDEESCVSCGRCEEVCPIGAVSLFEGRPLVCDLCGGEPLCVQSCTMDALSLNPERRGEVSLEKFREESASQSTEEKRIEFCRWQGRELRKKWEGE